MYAIQDLSDDNSSKFMLCSLDPITGVATQISEVAIPEGVSFSDDGYAVNEKTNTLIIEGYSGSVNSLYSVDLSTGDVETFSTIDIAAVFYNGSQLYAIESLPGNKYALCSIDESGTRIKVVDLTLPDNGSFSDDGYTLDEETNTLLIDGYRSGVSCVYSVDLSTGVVTEQLVHHGMVLFP